MVGIFGDGSRAGAKVTPGMWRALSSMATSSAWNQPCDAAGCELCVSSTVAVFDCGTIGRLSVVSCTEPVVAVESALGIVTLVFMLEPCVEWLRGCSYTGAEKAEGMRSAAAYGDVGGFDEADARGRGWRRRVAEVGAGVDPGQAGV